jgi:hypothetical protein
MDFSLHHAQTRSRTHQLSYSISIKRSFCGDKTAWAFLWPSRSAFWRWTCTFIRFHVQIFSFKVKKISISYILLLCWPVIVLALSTIFYTRIIFFWKPKSYISLKITKIKTFVRNVDIKFKIWRTILLLFMTFILPFTVAHAVEALCYKPKGRGFEPRWGHWIFSIDLILSPALWPWGRLSL